MEKKILFPTDFSEAANRAFLYALNLAKATSAEIFVLHCYEMPVLSSVNAGNPELIQEAYESIELSEFEHFKDEVPKMHELAESHDLGEIPLHFIFKEGVLTNEIEELIEEEDINYVVMGTKGANSIEDRLFGSNTLRVMEHVDIPVLTVPEEAEFKGLKKIGLSSLLKDSDKKELYRLCEIAKRWDASVEVVHMIDSEGFSEEKLNEWVEEFSRYGVHFHTITGVDVEDAMFDFIDEHSLDLMCIIKRQMGFLEKLFKGSLSKKLVEHSYVPILVLREEK